MKKIYIVFFCLFASLCFSQAPKLINYQGVVRNASGQPFTSPVKIRFEIYSSASGGTAVFSEIQTTNTNTLGLFSTKIGQTVPLNINWETGSWFLEVAVDTANMSNFVSLGRQQMVSVPFAIYAESAGSAPAPTVTFSNNILYVGTNSVSIPAPPVLSSGNGISISSGTITNTAPDQTVNISGTGNAQITSAYPDFTVNVNPQSLSINSNSITLSNGGGTIVLPATSSTPNTSLSATGVASVTTSGTNTFNINVPNPSLSIGGNTLTITQGTATSDVTLPSSPTPTITGLGVAVVSPTTGSNFSINVPSPALSFTNGSGALSVTQGTSVSTVTIPPSVTPTITGAGTASVSSAGSNYTVNTPPVNMSYTPGTGVLSYSPALGTNTLNLSPLVTFAGNTLTVGSNSTTIPGTGFWSASGSTAIAVTNTNHFVGIGTNNPQTILDIRAPFGTMPTLQLTSPSATAGVSGGMIDFNGYSAPLNQPSVRLRSLDDGNYSGDFIFQTRNQGITFTGLHDRLRFRSNGTIWMHPVNSSPNNVIVFDAISPSQLRIFSGLSGPGTAADLILGAAPSGSMNQLTLKTNGHVGVGTAFPLTKLDVYGISAATGYSLGSNSPETSIRITNDNMGNGNYSSLIFSTLSSNAGIYEAAKIVALNTNHLLGIQSTDLVFLSSNNNALNERMRIHSGGNVGMGTSTPLYNLHLESSAGNTRLALIAPSTSLSSIWFGRPGFHDAGKIDFIHSTNEMAFSVLSGNPTLRLFSAGNAAIGSTLTGNPAGSFLHIAQPGPNNTKVMISGGDNNNSYGGMLSFGENMNSSVGMSIRLDAIGNRLIFTNDLAGSTGVMGVGGYLGANPGVMIGQSYAFGNAPLDGLAVQGSVGVGTTTPTEKLEVIGNVKIPSTNDYRYATPKQKFVSMPATAFRSENPLNYESGFLSGCLSPIGTTPGTACYFVGALYLPDGATVTAVDAYVADNDANYNFIAAYLWRQPGVVGSGYGNPSIMASTPGTTGQSSVIQQLTTTTISSPIINNNANSYYVRIGISQPSTNNEIRIAKVVVTYNVIKTD